MYLQRKKFHYLIFIAVFLLLLLSACSEKQQQPANNEPTATTSDEQAAPEFITFSHLRGDSEVPFKPTRVVVLSATYIDHMLAIGERPIGVNIEARYGGDYLPYFAEQLQGTVLVGSADQPNLEAIVELDPQVIIVESRTDDNTYSELNKIAPTLVLGTEWLNYEQDPLFWTKDLFAIASLFGKEEEAQAQVDKTNALTNEAAQKIQATSNKQTAYLRVRESMVQIYAGNGHPLSNLLYHDLGFSPSPLTPKDQREDISLEMLPELQADFLYLEIDPNASDFMSEMSGSSLWQTVPAVQNDRVFTTDSFWLFKAWGALGRQAIVHEIMQGLE